jgi:hypothetical protein
MNVEGNTYRKSPKRNTKLSSKIAKRSKTATIQKP